MPVTRKIVPDLPEEESKLSPGNGHLEAAQSYRRNRYDLQVRIIDLDSKQTIFSASALYLSVGDIRSSSFRLYASIRSICLSAVYQLQAILSGKPTLPPDIDLGKHDEARANQLASLLQAGKVGTGYSTVLPMNPADPREFIMITRLRKQD